MAQTAIKLLIPSFPREAQRGFFMRQHPVLNGIFAIACGVLTNAGTAQAGNESWVSATGNDTGTCPITAPCRTFAYAHDQTVANGTINVLSSGSFGPLTIAKRISIVAQGVEALIDTGANSAAVSSRRLRMLLCRCVA